MVTIRPRNDSVICGAIARAEAKAAMTAAPTQFTRGSLPWTLDEGAGWQRRVTYLDHFTRVEGRGSVKPRPNLFGAEMLKAFPPPFQVIPWSRRIGHASAPNRVGSVFGASELHASAFLRVRRAVAYACV